MFRLPSASKIHATLEPAGAAVRPLGKGALSAASMVNDGCCAAAVPTAKAALPRRAAPIRWSMDGELMDGVTVDGMLSGDIIRRVRRGA
jgi:hypothetical protein